MKKPIINLEFFTHPKPRFINNIKLRKYDIDKLDVYSKDPCIFISPNTSVIDKQLLTRCIHSKFLFINDNIIKQINLGQMKDNKLLNLLSEIKNLSNLGYSFALVWNNSPTIFGDNEAVSENLSLFLYKTNLDIKFLTFPNLYFSHPIWAPNPRHSKIFSSQKITITHKMLESFSKSEILNLFKNSTPSSANVYSNKIPTNIRSNQRAVGLERIMYCCPTCEKLCTLYSEYSCMKCKSCGSVFEINTDGKILFSKKLSNFDEIENYQFSVLKHYDFDVNKITSYNKITQIITEKCKKPIKMDVNLQIYADKLKIINPITNKEKDISLEDIKNINFNHNNNISIEIKNAKELHFCGNNNENFYIIKDLVSINKN